MKPSQIMQENLNAIHAARKAFIASENDKKNQKSPDTIYELQVKPNIKQEILFSTKEKTKMIAVVHEHRWTSQQTSVYKAWQFRHTCSSLYITTRQTSVKNRNHCNRTN